MRFIFEDLCKRLPSMPNTAPPDTAGHAGSACELKSSCDATDQVGLDCRDLASSRNRAIAWQQC